MNPIGEVLKFGVTVICYTKHLWIISLDNTVL